MKRKTPGKQRRVARQALKIASLAPIVATARLASSAARPSSSAADWRRMGREKTSVFSASAFAMMFAGTSAIARTMAAWTTAFSPWGGTAHQRLARIQTAAANASADVTHAGLAPIAKRVRANARRLGR